MAIGQLSDLFTIYGGVTLLDPEVRGTGNPATNGKQYAGMPKVRSNILLEYRVPQVVGLVATFDWQYVDRRPGNDTNTTWTPSYSTFDIGARSVAPILSKMTTWRIAVNNVSNTHYWSTIGPSKQHYRFQHRQHGRAPGRAAHAAGIGDGGFLSVRRRSLPSVLTGRRNPHGRHCGRVKPDRCFERTSRECGSQGTDLGGVVSGGITLRHGGPRCLRRSPRSGTAQMQNGTAATAPWATRCDSRFRDSAAPKECMVEPKDSAVLRRQCPPCHAVERDVRERMSERRQLPVEYRDHARLGRMEHQVAHAKIAVTERRFDPLRNVLRQPRDELFKGRILARLRALPLSSPSRDLANHKRNFRACRSRPGRCCSNRRRGGAPWFQPSTRTSWRDRTTRALEANSPGTPGDATSKSGELSPALKTSSPVTRKASASISGLIPSLYSLQLARNLRLDQCRELRERLLPTEIAHFKRDRGGNAALCDIQLGSTNHGRQGHRHFE